MLTLDDLKPADYNPRVITEKAANGLKTSLQRFGDIGGLVFNRRTGRLVAGHQRMEQLRAAHGDGLALRHVADGDPRVVAPDGNEWPVRIVDWDEATEKAANVAANNPAIQGDWDDGKLQSLLEELEAEERATAASVSASAVEDDLNGGASLEEDLEEWTLRDGVVRGRARRLSGLASAHQVERKDLEKALWKIQRGLGRDYLSVTSHPAMIGARNASKNWKLVSVGKFKGMSSALGGKTCITGRKTFTYRYCGEAMDCAAASQLWG